MGSKFTTQSASGYNSSPPPDDGSQNASNLITWAGIKNKLADPTKNLVDAINSALVTAFDYSVRQVTTSDNILTSDHMRTVEIAPSATSGVTITLPDAATATNNFRVFIKNSSQFSQTLARTTSGNTIDAVAENYTIPAGFAGLICTTTGADGFLFIGAYDESEPDICQGRLTLTSGTPVTTTDVTSATTVYFSLYKGDKIALFDGKRWRRFTFTELSIAVPATTNTMYDVFCYDNAGTPALEVASWTSDTARATSLTTQDGVYVKTGALTRRYLGSFRTTTTSGQTEDSLAKRYVWNYHNRVNRPLRNTFSADRSTSSTSYAELNSEIRLQFIHGLAEDPVVVGVGGSCGSGTSANQIYKTAIAFDGTTAEPGLQNCYTVGANINSGCGVPQAAKAGLLGFHYATLLGANSAGNSTSWHSADAATTQKVYLHGWVRG